MGMVAQAPSKKHLVKVIMEIQTHLMLLLLGVFLLSTSVFGANVVPIDDDYGIGSLNRSSFPKGFIFGTASSAYQVEGASREDGKGPSMWDTWTHTHPEKIFDGSTGDVAIDSYHRYKEDVKLMKELGVDGFRLSISWTRILPHGKLSKGVNKKGIEHYHKVFDELLANGIQPFVTLFHWDIPQALQDEYGGFLSHKIVDDFVDYVDICFKEYGDKIKHWITLNEPWSYSHQGYAGGTFAPGRCSAWMNQNCTGGDSATEPYIVAHNEILAHAAAVQLYRRKYQASQKGVIGITLVTHWFVPIAEVKRHQYAAMRALDFMFGWFMDPITNGDYPRTMRSLVKGRLQRFTAEQTKMIKGSYDFLGLNYYTSMYAEYRHNLKGARPSFDNDQLVHQTAERNGKLIGVEAGSDWLHIYPKGLRDLLLHIKRKYNNPIIYITENGVDTLRNDKLPLKKDLDDKIRVTYYHGHLAFLNLAIKEGANVKGYFAWTFSDDYEWDAGYTVRFGLYYIDFKNGLKRIPKFSALWFKKFLQKNKKLN